MFDIVDYLIIEIIIDYDIYHLYDIYVPIYIYMVRFYTHV